MPLRFFIKPVVDIRRRRAREEETMTSGGGEQERWNEKRPRGNLSDG